MFSLRVHSPQNASCCLGCFRVGHSILSTTTVHDLLSLSCAVPLAGFLTAVLKARPELLNDWKAKLWCRFFCLSVYATMYLNDHQRTAFYESLGMNTKQFNQHVIIETNRTTARIFPAVCDVENPEFFARLDRVRALSFTMARPRGLRAP